MRELECKRKVKQGGRGEREGGGGKREGEREGDGEGGGGIRGLEFYVHELL